ncbi:thioredoxin [Marinilabiliaceae bacterium JC017]|nr:thioredoxin [Marinilabiliaceae bacterium JC017]
MMQLMVLAAFFLSTISCVAEKKSDKSTVLPKEGSSSKVIHLTKESFKEQVFDYATNKEWKYKGKVPAIVDFYADWCGPCRQLAPVLEAIQKEYGNAIQIYKVNTDKEKELASVFGVRSLPTVVFIPVDGEPQAALGFRPQAELEKVIEEVLKIKKEN